MGSWLIRMTIKIENKLNNRNSDDQLVLYRHQYVSEQRNKKRDLIVIWSVALVAGVLVLLLLYFQGVFELFQELEPREVWQKLKEKIAEKPIGFSLNALVLVLGLLQIVFMKFYHKEAKLIISRLGIEHHSGKYSLFSSEKSWRASWGEIKSLKFQFKQSIWSPFQSADLIVDLGVRQHTIETFKWGDINDPNFDLYNPQNTMSSDKDKTISKLQFHPLYLYLQKLDKAPAIPDLGSKQAARFNLFSGASSMSVVVVLFVIILYAIVDSIILNESYIEGALWEWHVAFGIVAGLLSFFLLKLSHVPVTESVTVSVLLVVAIVFALYPGVLRINQLTDSQGLVRYEYVKRSSFLYEAPKNADLPPLQLSEFADFHEYWQQFAVGSTYQFELRRGGLGFYQYNQQPIRKAMKAYYRQ